MVVVHTWISFFCTAEYLTDMTNKTEQNNNKKTNRREIHY